ncbi:MAG: hypothetical protein JSS02_00235 [Planctomycetes bacterium]|nr:hypothetical protein [Planctomycetota bacterium]
MTVSSLATAVEPPAPVWKITERIAAPSHALYDADTQTIFVSQISGEGDEKDGIGVISRISVAGKMQDSDWVNRLDAPKGLARTGKTLWVSDIDRVHEIDIATGEIPRCHEIPGARFLTGVAARRDGRVYVADMLTSTIHALHEGRPTVFQQGGFLESPAGLCVDQNRLVVAAWGLTTDYTTKVPGKFYLLDGRTPQALSNPLGNLYGVVSDGARGWIGSDFSSGRIFHLTEQREPRVLLELEAGVGGIEFIREQNLLIVPELTANRISAYDLSHQLKPKSQ